MSAQIIPLRGAAAPVAVDQDVLDALHDAQVIAERGHVVGLAYILLTPAGPIWAGDGAILATNGDARMMIGCLEELKQFLVGSLDD